MPTGLGTAIALGNIARVSNTQPFTQAVLNRQRLDLAREEKKAKQAQAAKEQEKYLNSLIQFYDGGFSPFFQEQASKIVSEGLGKQLQHRSNRNQIGIAFEGNEMKRKLADLKMQDEALTKVLDQADKGQFILPPELRQGFQGIRSQSESGIQNFLKANPQYESVVKYDPNSNAYSFNMINDVDIPKLVETRIKDTRPEMRFVKRGAKLDNNTYETIYQHDPATITGFAAAEASNPTTVTNVEIKYPDRFKKELAAATVAMPNSHAEDIRKIAAAKILEEEFTKHNKYVKQETSFIPYQNNQNSGGGYAVAGKTFNPSLSSGLQNLDAYVKAGVLTSADAAYIKSAQRTNPDVVSQSFPQLQDVISIDPPNTGVFNIRDENGKEYKTDNLKAVYIPKTNNGKGGQWFMTGVDDLGRPVTIPINERTYGNIISVYGKMSTDDIEKLFNQRMKDGGITNDVFSLKPLKPKSVTSQAGSVIYNKYKRPTK